ncbi:MAG: putative Polyadenylate-binding protein 1 [Streblomastix strix]|uniref:Putative Polyadenylate-binding protein 1 n=1 Tax=Streblomastix strix TaxID=222440 RepID=A0A5J4X7L4_9EUKA|nr:MAG: putative Polyadenylate-binding protein 1 [Streblomastix strix]
MSYRQFSLFIGDLDDDVVEDDLQHYFNEKLESTEAVLSTKVCRDYNNPQKSLGYGYVNFSRQEHVDKALELLNYQTIPGKNKPYRLSRYQPDQSKRKTGEGNVFVDNLPTTFDSKKLHDIFSEYGVIVSCRISEHHGPAKGKHGFIQYESKEEADKAIEKMNNYTVEQQQITVEQYRPQAFDNLFDDSFMKEHPEQSSAYSRFEREKYERQLGEKTRFRNLYVRGFPIDYTDTDLKALFSEYGQITSVKVMRNEQGVSRGFGLCQYEKDEEAALALKQLKGKVIDGTTDELIVNYCQTREERTTTYRRRMQARQQTHNRQQPQQQNQQAFQGYNRSRQMNQQGFNANNQGQQQNIMNMNNELNQLMLQMQALQNMNFMNPMNFNPQLYNQFFNLPNQIPPLQPNPLPQQNIQGPVEQQNNIPSFQSSPQDSNNEAPEPLIQQRTIQQGPQPQPLQQQLIPQLNPIHSQGEQILPTPLDQNTQSSGSLSPQQAQTTPSISQVSGDGTPAAVSAQVAGVIRSAGLAPVMIDQQQLGQMAEEEQKQNLGEYLFTQITKIDETNSGKITGMLLELEVVDLVKLLEDPAELVNKVQEAQQVLVDAQKNGQIDDSE